MWFGALAISGLMFVTKKRKY
ncbi:hypothetical protein FD515_08540 [Cutibacterium acnes]|nr:hypothetical protein [Cutibacterium acnes]MUT48564.1 hypothetical protein [Cutibacterium acnes]MUT76679.1 hypothetical protein [Cutibacterium acnes]TLF50335.1 hypothetical protein FD534_04500 [Cutibacterium acnes]TLF83215.1 hypothetical protein FD532_05930 [Cutibacterium acnes]